MSILQTPVFGHHSSGTFKSTEKENEGQPCLNIPHGKSMDIEEKPEELTPGVIESGGIKPGEK